MVFLAETRDFVAGEHEVRGGGTRKSQVHLYSWHFQLKLEILYQENMRSEELARESRRIICTPGISSWNSRFCIKRTWGPRRWHEKIAGSSILLIFLAETRHFVSGEHEVRGGRTRKLEVQLYSWYFKLSKNVLERIIEERDGLSSWTSRFCIRRIWGPRRWHEKVAGPAVLLIHQIFEKCFSANNRGTGWSF